MTDGSDQKTLYESANEIEINGDVVTITKEISLSSGYTYFIRPNDNVVNSINYITFDYQPVIYGSDFKFVAQYYVGSQLVSSKVFTEFNKPGDTKQATLYGQWTYDSDGKQYEFGRWKWKSEDNTSNLQKTISIRKSTSDTSIKNENVLFSPLYEIVNNVFYIKECVIDNVCVLEYYPKLEDVDDGSKRLKYIKYPLPESMIMRSITVENDASLKLNSGSVFLSEGSYFKSDGSIAVQGWKESMDEIIKVTGTTSETKLTYTDGQSDLLITEFKKEIRKGNNQYYSTSNINLYVDGVETLRGNPFNIIFNYRATAAGQFVKYNIKKIISNTLETVCGNWHYLYPDSEHHVYYEKDGEIITYSNDNIDIKIGFDSTDGIVPWYECSGNSNFEVTMVREDFVVNSNITLEYVEYDRHVYVDRPFKYIFENLKVETRNTLSAPDSSIIVRGNLEVEEGATVKCKNLIIN